MLSGKVKGPGVMWDREEPCEMRLNWFTSCRTSQGVERPIRRFGSCGSAVRPGYGDGI